MFRLCLSATLILTCASLEHAMLKEDITVEEILNYAPNSPSVSPKQFSGKLLAFVTPWNLNGLNIWKQNKHKIDVAIPVLFEVAYDHATQRYFVTGNIDFEIEGYPRYMLKQGSLGPHLEDAAQTIKNHCLAHQSICKGVMLDGWGALSQYKSQALSEYASLIRALEGLNVVVSIPSSQGMLRAMNGFIRDTKQYVQYYIIMTYDYLFQEPSNFNSPLFFIDRTMKGIGASGPQFAIGINFYGYSLCHSAGSTAVVDRKNYKDWLRLSSGKLRWVTHWKGNNIFEHIFTTRDSDCIINYPTLMSLYRRIQYAEERGYSIGIWELGQGMDYFMDVF